MIYPYISFSNNHFSNIFAIFAFNETSKIVKQDHDQETTQGNPHRLRRLPATRLPSGRKVPAPDRLPTAHRTTGNRITAAETPPSVPGMRLAPTSETPLPSPTHGASPGCRAGCSRRNTSNSCRYSCPISDVTPTLSGEGANFHSHLKSKGSC